MVVCHVGGCDVVVCHVGGCGVVVCHVGGSPWWSVSRRVWCGGLSCRRVWLVVCHVGGLVWWSSRGHGNVV